MGRNLLRRKTLKLLNAFVFFMTTSFLNGGEASSETGLFPEPLPAVRKMPRQEIPAYEPPVQNHLGPKAVSFEIPDNVLVTNEIKKLSTAGGKKWIATCLERSLPYRQFIQSKILEYEMPEEFFYLPIVESTYLPTAVSRSGAAGLWQFMKNSVSPFGMVVNEWVDERFDFWKSTEASLKKLRENYQYFGDWYLAIGAYNCGLGRMSRIIKQSGIRDFWILAKKGLLPGETARYVPRFLAVVSIASHAVTNGLQIGWESGTIWERILIDKPVDLTILSEETDIPLELLKKGNVELRYNVTPPDGTAYYLKVPVQYAETVERAVSDPGRKLLNFYVHRIQSGDTLYDLARHFGIPVSMIEKYNKGLRADRLRVGQNVLVPTLKNASPYRKEIDPEELKTYTGIHIVGAGDTLWSISHLYGTTPEKLAAANDITVATPIRTGITLNVPENKTDN